MEAPSLQKKPDELRNFICNKQGQASPTQKPRNFADLSPLKIKIDYY